MRMIYGNYLTGSGVIRVCAPDVTCFAPRAVA